MSVLSSTSVGIPKTGQRIVISGVEKVGKTTLACDAPRAILIPMEIGYASITISKTKMIESYDEVMGLLDEITTEAKAGRWQFQSIIFDSATALERLIHDAVLQSDPAYVNKNKKAVTMESALGGYGKAYQFANELFLRFTKKCDDLAIYAGINIILTCHVFASKVIDPTYGEYHTWDLLLHSPKNEKNYGKRELITQWADMVGFLNEPISILHGKEGETVKRAVNLNKGRVLAVDRNPSWVAGNRYGLVGEIGIPAVGGWNYLADAIMKSKGIDIYNKD